MKSLPADYSIHTFNDPCEVPEGYDEDVLKLVQALLDEEMAQYTQMTGIDRKPRSSESIKDFFYGDTILHMVEHDATAVAFLAHYSTTTGEFIDTLYVHKDHRRKGLATVLLNRVTDVDSDVTIDISVLNNNLDALNLYSSLGFIPTTTTMTFKSKDA